MEDKKKKKRQRNEMPQCQPVLTKQINKSTRSRWGCTRSVSARKQRRQSLRDECRSVKQINLKSCLLTLEIEMIEESVVVVVDRRSDLMTLQGLIAHFSRDQCVAINCVS